MIFEGCKTIRDGQAIIDLICHEYLIENKPEPKAVKTICNHGTPLMNRAISYVESAGPAATGDRNNTAFRLAGHLVAIVDEVGNRLNEDQIIELMESWNRYNLDPLPENEIRRVAISAMKNGTPRDDKGPEIRVPEIDLEVDISNITGTPKPRPKPKPKPKPKLEFERFELPGLIGDIVKHNLETAYYPLPELALAGAIALMSTILGGKVSFGGARSNLYVMALAPSGAGKDHSRKLNRKILRLAGHGEICGPERIGSHAGIISALAENWRTLFQIDEIGRMLATVSNASMNPHLYNITTVLMQVYSSADDVWQGDAYGDRKKVKTLAYPHCVVYGSSIPDGFWESISKDNLTNGLIGRFLIFENPDYVDYQAAKHAEIPDSIIERAKSWLDLDTHGGNLMGSTESDGAHAQQVRADEQSADRLHQHAMEISQKRKQEEHTSAAVWSRHAEKTNKLALLFACSRWSPGDPWPTIRIEDADIAIRLNNWLTRRMLERAGMWVSENQNEKDTLKVLRLIQAKPGITSTELGRKLRWLKARDKREILNSLHESGEIVSEAVNSGGGRPKVGYWPVWDGDGS
jgi:hypothetical protein